MHFHGRSFDGLMSVGYGHDVTYYQQTATCILAHATAAETMILWRHAIFRRRCS
jgi:hypothetical protein